MLKSHTQNHPVGFAGATDTTGIFCRDKDGNNYKTVKIGTQVWMAENLKTTTYNDGTPIPLVTDSATWSNLLTPGYCWYNNIDNNNAYGALYNWFTVNTGKLAPAGWHIPTDEEWTILTTYLGGEKMAGGKLKDKSKNYWKSPNAGATNNSGFTALPAGHCDNNATFSLFGNNGYWWSSSEYGSTGKVWYRSMDFNSSGIFRANNNKKNGHSIRCIKDAISTTQPSLTTNTITDITQTTATSGGNITSDGGSTITFVGVCWSTSENPTIDNNKTSNGSGTGSFSSTLTGLTANTTYYVRAYITNIQATAYATNTQSTSYGNQVIFTTEQATPQPTPLKKAIDLANNKALFTATPKNPTGFTATRIANGDVILRWNSVQNAATYNLQGSGVKPGVSRPGAVVNNTVNVTGTTYTVRGLMAGTHSWVLFTMYNGASGLYYGDELNPSRTNLTISANPTGFRAVLQTNGDVILTWNSVPIAMNYNLQGPGVKPGVSRPGAVVSNTVNITGTTYTVKGLKAGTHSWGLFAVYSAPNGPYFGDELNPSRTSLTIAVTPQLSASPTAKWTNFDPARHGFRFSNTFHNNVVGPPINIESGGLCGGMSYAALDYYNAGRPIPNQTYRPANNTAMQAYIYNRQVNSLTSNIDKWLEISVNPLALRTTEFFNWGINERLREIISFIDRGVPVQLGLKGSEGTLNHDHQVLVIGYDIGRYQFDLGNYKEDIRIYIFDPNYPTQTLTLLPNSTAKEYYYLEHPDDRWRTYFADSRYAFVNPPVITNPVYPSDGLIHELLFYFSTGADDMRGGADHVDVTVIMKDNSREYYPNISQNGRWLPNYMETAQIVLRQPVAQGTISSIEISTNAANNITGDNWDLLTVKVKGITGGYNGEMLISSAGPWRFTGARTPLIIYVK